MMFTSMNTKTKYLGLDVESPIIVGSCGLTNNIENLEQLEAAGAGAVVLKSVFEEQIILDIKRNMPVVAPADQYGASYEYIAAHVAQDSMNKHFQLIGEAKRRLHIPVVGSINCYQFENWLTYAKRFEDAGCDALELNMAVMPFETTTSSDDIERLYQDVVGTLKRSVSIPISVKVSGYFTDMAKFMEQLSWRGIGGITLFNRPMNIDIDLDRQELTQAPSLSSHDDMYNTLRWVAVLSRKVRCGLSASTGVHTADDVVKMLLAGAQTVQVVSCLYKNGLGYMKELNDGLRRRMESMGYESVDQMCGRFAIRPNDDASMFFRTQFMKYMGEIK